MRWLGGVVCVVTMALSAWTAAEAQPSPGATARVVQFSPQGEVKGVRQVVARFSEAMVALGDPRGPAPFDVDCPHPGSSRWIDTRHWAHELEEDLPAGVRCTFTVRDDAVSLLGKPVAATTYAFSTGGPAVVGNDPSEGSLIEEEQAFILSLDAQATPESVLAHSWFVVDGIAERVGVRLVEGPEREAILATSHYLSDPRIVVQARQRFPSSAKVSLFWGKGISTTTGVETSSEQTFSFEVRTAFKTELSCLRENKKADCMPISVLRLRFSALVPREHAALIRLRSADGQEWKPELPEHEAAVSAVAFEPPFPERATFELSIPDDLRDDSGRPLIDAERFPLEVKTGPFPPLAKFSSRFGIIESEAEPVLPVTLRSVEPEVPATVSRATAERPSGWAATVSELWDRVTGRVRHLDAAEVDAIVPWLKRVALANRTRSVFGEAAAAPESQLQTFKVPKPHAPEAMEVVGIPLGSPGLYIVELESPRLGESLLGKDAPMYVPTAALVTNMAVHFKWGKERSLVWVTTLDEARPVSGAEVIVQDCTESVLWKGTTDAEGIAYVDGLPGDAAECYPEWSTPWDEGTAEAKDSWLNYDYEQTQALRSMSAGLLVIARTPRDLSFTHSSWKRGIEPWRFRLPTSYVETPVIAHTVFDRTLFRAGETVHMKHFARLKEIGGLAVAPAAGRPPALFIEHEGSRDKFDLPLEWDASGVALSNWEIPERAKLGRYRVVLGRAGDWRDRHHTGSFRVEEFRLPLMRASVGLPAKPQVAVTSIPVDLEAHYLAGGAAADLPVVVRAQVRKRGFSPPTELERFTFSNGTVEPGVKRTDFDDDDRTPSSAVHQRHDLELQPTGTGRTTITDLPIVGAPSEVLVEMEFRDPNGERQTVASTAPLWPADHLIGIDVDSWTSVRDELRSTAVVVDLDGKPIAGAGVRVEAFKRTTYSSRQRLAGGFYAYEHVTEISPSLGVLCEGVTEDNGLFFCTATPAADGNLILVAFTEDAGGRVSAAHDEVWVAGESPWWFEVGHSDRIDVIPEKPRYEPGETARLQVRAPFSQATALVAVEREGVAEAYVVELSGKNPVIEVPMRDSYAPNVFVSVLAVRGRVGDVQPTAVVDLGRPAYKLGVAELRVGWQAHRLDVEVEPSASVFRVRQNASARIRVRLPHGKAPPAGTEVAFAAVDEGLLELQPNGSWDLLAAMMGRRNYQVETSTAQTQVIGKRHYGLKALPAGGGGGRQSTRELFDTLLLWNPRVALDAAGDAVVEVPLNDSLTSFRLVAVASAGEDRFGTGATTIRTTQDLMVLPSIAPLAREGDAFDASATVRNTTDGDLEVSVSASASGLPLLPPQRLSLAVGAAATVDWDIAVPTGVDAIEYIFDASATGGAADSVRVRQSVEPAVPVRTFQATLAQCDDAVHETVQRPSDAVEGRGGVRVVLAPTLLAGLDGVQRWAADYPYSCFEQKLAKAVITAAPEEWRALRELVPTYLDDAGLLRYFPTQGRGSDVLTAHTLALTNAADLEIPEESRDRMLDGLAAFVDGKLGRQDEHALAAGSLALRKLAAIEALSRFGAARPEMLDSITIEPNLWPTAAVINWWSILLRLPQIPDRTVRLNQTEQILRSRLDLAGTSAGFSTESVDSFGWLMVTPDVNPQRLILNALTAGVWEEDLPRLMQGAFTRQRHGAWDSTVSNAWGSVAVRKFAARFEAETVSGVTTASMGESVRQVDWGAAPKEAAVEIPWSSNAATLSIVHRGTGAPWAVVQARAAIPLKKPLSAGYRIAKTVTPVESKQSGALTTGDILRVRLEVEAQRDMAWVVVDDPIPAGASHLGTGMARDSQITAGSQPAETWLAPDFVERTFGAVRAYYEYLHKGSHVFEYTIRLNQPGTFQLPSTRAEALYSPEMFGELPNEPVVVKP